MSAAVIDSSDGYERRARLRPWGIEVQVWRLVETLTLPSTAAKLSLAALLSGEKPPEAIPGNYDDDEPTLEDLVEELTLENLIHQTSGRAGEKDK